MIDQVLTFFETELNRYFQSRFQLKSTDKRAIVASLMSGEGKMNSEAREKLVISLINLSEEKNVQGNANHYARAGNKPIGRLSPPVDLNLNLLFAANFKDQKEALKYISAVIGYFQVNRSFSPSAFPRLDASIDKLNAEIVNHDVDTLNNLWSLIGTHYMPSMVYRMRSIRVQEGKVKGEVGPITGIDPRT